MPVNLGAKPDHGFDEPLGLLSDCHRRIEKFLEILRTVSLRRQGAALDSEERQALGSALEYFRRAAPRHTQDEEESLFPRLRGVADARVAAALRDLQRLEADHQAAEAMHAEVDRLVMRWLEADRLPENGAAELTRLLSRLRELYREHIALEDERVFPLAAETLSPEQVREVGGEMAARRGLAASAPSRPQSGG